MRFTLRDLFWLLFVVALIAGWLVDHRNQRAANVHLVRHHKKLEMKWINTSIESDKRWVVQVNKLTEENLRLSSGVGSP
jgi:hypothetical protein